MRNSRMLGVIPRRLPSTQSMQEVDSSAYDLSDAQQVASVSGPKEEKHFAIPADDLQTLPLATSGLKEMEWKSLPQAFYADLQVPMKKAVESLGDAQFTIALAPGSRRFGEFQEKTIIANAAAKVAITNVCRSKNFVPAWSDSSENSERGYRMTKIPVIVLTRLLAELGNDHEVVNAIRGAYPIAMDPQSQYSTCMNVIVGKRPNGAIEKFSLYYTDPVNENAERPLWQGFSLRTGAFTDKHILNRDVLQQASNLIGLDGPEDALYVKAMGLGNDRRSMLDAFEQIIASLEDNGRIGLVNSHDPDSKITAAREELELVKAHC